MSTAYTNTDLLTVIAEKLSANEKVSSMGTPDLIMVPLWTTERPARGLIELIQSMFGTRFTKTVCLSVRYSTCSGFTLSGIASSDIVGRITPSELIRTVVSAIKERYASTHGWEAALNDVLAELDDLDVDAL